LIADLLVYHYAAATRLLAGTHAARHTFALAAGDVRPEGIADPPALSLAGPEDGTMVPADQPVLVTGKAVPSQSDSPVAYVTISGRPVDALDASGTFFTQFTPALGRNVLEVVATDVTGESAGATVTVTGTRQSSAAADLGELADVSGAMTAEYVRVEFPEAVYHVTARGNKRRAIYRDVYGYRDGSGVHRVVKRLEEAARRDKVLSQRLNALAGEATSV
jgi:hypothetical protein